MTLQHNNNVSESDFTDFVEAPVIATANTTTSVNSQYTDNMDKQTQIIVEKIKALASTINDLPKLQ